MIGNGCDVRTVASYLGHASVSMTLDIYADVDPDAKRAAVDKVLESFDVDESFLDGYIDWDTPPSKRRESASAVSFTEEQLLAMLDDIRRQKGEGGCCRLRVAKAIWKICRWLFRSVFRFM